MEWESALQAAVSLFEQAVQADREGNLAIAFDKYNEGLDLAVAIVKGGQT
jgi:hypothetical protein